MHALFSRTYSGFEISSRRRHQPSVR
jgi:hypothetical protein